MKTTQATVYRALQHQINKMEDRLLDQRLSAATGKRINKPSDDPSAVRPVLNARSQIQQSDRYLRSLGTASDRLQIQDSHLDQVSNLLIRAQETTIAAGNGAASAADLQSYANDIANIREELYALANSQVDGKYIFAGFEENTIPFPDTSDPFTYDGTSDEIRLEIAPGEKIQTNLTGDRLFQGAGIPGGINLFDLLSQIETSLTSNDPTAALSHLDDLKAGSEQVSLMRSKMGNIAQRVENAQLHMENVKIDMQEVLSRYEDVDIVETITNLNQQQLAFEAALNVTGKVSELSILNYL
ncbi:MAG: flagellar hook-associated protein FlgL [Syntrophotaleaceae bacterium]